MNQVVLALSQHTGRRLAEVGFLLVLLAGVWIVIAQLPRFRMGAGRSSIAGLALAIGGLLLIVATHWGHFG